MPRSDRACRSGNNLADGSLGTIFFCLPAAPSLDLGLAGLLALRPPADFLRTGTFRSLSSRALNIHVGLVPPREPLAAAPEAREIAPARSTTIGSCAEPEEDRGPARRAIILLAPCGQFLPVTARAPGVLPRVIGPHTGLPAMAASAAAQRIDPDPAFEEFRKILAMGQPHFTRVTLRA